MTLDLLFLSISVVVPRYTLLCHPLVYMLLPDFPVQCVCLFAGSFIGEESAVEGQHVTLTDNATWIIDPVDGTTNFVHK